MRGNTVGTVDFIDDRVHLALEYVSIANRSGAPLALTDLAAFANQPVPRPRQVSNIASDMAAIALRTLQYQTTPGEQIEQFVTRTRWVIDDERNGLKLTRLGRAVLDYANRPPLQNDADEPLTVTIDPEDKFAYSKVLGLIAAQGEGMLVDPYLTLDGLQDIVTASSTTRILTTDRNQRRRLSLIAHGLGVIENAPEVRRVGASKLHDRFFIGDEGPVYVLGSSLNSIARRPGVITPIADAAASGAIRTAYEAIWAEGAPIEPSAPAGEAGTLT